MGSKKADRDKNKNAGNKLAHQRVVLISIFPNGDHFTKKKSQALKKQINFFSTITKLFPCPIIALTICSVLLSHSIR